jgi:4-hydroxybenzoate polyprenyltransferase
MRPLQLIKTARPGFWPTHLWFFLLPLGQRQMFGSLAFWLGCLYVCFPLGLITYGWNDLFDAETDRRNDRKDSWLFGARLDDAQLRALPWWIAAVQLPFAIGFTWLFGPKLLLWFAAIVAVNALYNWPRLGWKNWPVLDLLNQVGYLLVFVLASWVCQVEQLNAPAMIFSALFAMQSHLFGQVMDIDADRSAGRHTTASVLGVRSSKLGVVVLLVIDAAIARSFFRTGVVEAFLLIAAAFFVVDALAWHRDRPYPSWLSKAFFIAWNVVVLLTMHFVWSRGLFLLKEPGGS